MEKEYYKKYHPRHLKEMLAYCWLDYGIWTELGTLDWTMDFSLDYGFWIRLLPFCHRL